MRDAYIRAEGKQLCSPFASPRKLRNHWMNWQGFTGRAKTFCARQAILDHLDDLEDIYIAEQRPEKIRAGRAKPLSLEKVMKRQGVED